MQCTLPNDRTHSRKIFTVVAVTRSVVTVCVEPTIPEESGDDKERMTTGIIRPFEQVSYEYVYKIRSCKLHVWWSTAYRHFSHYYDLPT